MAWSQKVFWLWSHCQQKVPNYSTEQKIWISCLLLWARNLNFLHRGVIWHLLLPMEQNTKFLLRLSHFDKRGISLTFSPDFVPPPCEISLSYSKLWNPIHPGTNPWKILRIGGFEKITFHESTKSQISLTNLWGTILMITLVFSSKLHLRKHLQHLHAFD